MRFARPVALAVVALLGVAACRSTPSPKAVAQDYIESLDLEPDERDCMLERLDEYDNETLTSIGEANLNVNFNKPDAVESGSPEFQKFVDDLATCMNGSG